MATGQSVVGSTGNDTLTGTVNDDTILGLAGDDSLVGGVGNDSLDGGAGTDTIDAGDGDDLINANFDTVRAGAGNDTIIITDVSSVNGGAGNDTISGGTAFAWVYGDDGDDIITIGSGTVTGGSGQDRFIINPTVESFTNRQLAVTITDFASGPSGEVLDLTNILPVLTGPRGTSPFGTHLWIEALAGGTTQIIIDRDAAGSQYDRETLAVLQGVFANDLVAANFAGGWVPTRDKTISDNSQTGTAASETLAGGWGNDTIAGGAGNDSLSDTAGNNQLSGGDGNDTLTGGDGNDTLEGGDGADTLNGARGNDRLDGGNGDDFLVGEEYFQGGDDTLIGGAGNDTLYGHNGNDLLEGGDGDDTLGLYQPDNPSVRFYEVGSDTLRGGNGNDILSSAGGGQLFGDAGDDRLISGGISTLNGGDGNDVLQTRGGQMTGGAGADRFVLDGVTSRFTAYGTWDNYGVQSVTITDFSVTGGDVIDLSVILRTVYGYEGGNPFGRYLRLQQDGADTLITLDPDAGGLSQTNADRGVLARLQNVQVSSLTSSHFSPSFDLSVLAQYNPQTITGGDGNDLLRGGLGEDSLSGGKGADLLIGGGGNDVLRGGDGLDAAYFTAPPGNAAVVSVQQRTDASGATYFVVADHRVTGEGTDTLYDVEIGIFNNTILPLIAPQRWTPYQPYEKGQFDNAAYLALNPDVAAAVAAGIYKNGEEHYLAFGRAENRASPAVESGTVVLFDSNFYRLTNPDVDQAIRNGTVADAWTHFKQFGAKEGRDPNIMFDTDWYLASNPDVATAVANGWIDALTHFAKYGWKEGRDPSRWFDMSAYLDSNPDVAAVQGLNPLLHYLAYGYHEGRLTTFTELI